ncbi:hypothetical protein O181_025842 [Austropuccinia psidii MF-1]|uniref:Uncharacterized protein n=1 Tax=Austropuccinia psidii MF-1 TaxID=1389203 RepID=A0A9Q3CM06_9BASI|nr:hypothetical protein [Austropuccinia psidii MF-1]
MESTIIQISNQKYKQLSQQKKGGKQERSSNSFYKKFTSQPATPKGKKNKKNDWKKPYSPSFRILILQKDAMDNVLNMARSLMEFNNKEE